MIGLYARVSTKEQAKEGYSIDEQVERLKKYCEAHGRSDFKVFVDAGFSGANVDRPDLQKMIQEARVGKLEKVIVYKLDRLSRSQKDTLHLIEDEFLVNGVDFESMSERFDTGTSFGRAMIGILSVFAQLEREQIRERMEMGKEGRAKDGKWHGGCYQPVGYDYSEGELKVNEYEAMQIREACSLYAGGMSFSQIEREFAKRGYSHRYGDWTAKRIREVILNPLYSGVIRHGTAEYDGNHDAIIDDETYGKIRAIHDGRRKEDGRSKRIAGQTSYLGGLIWCKRCGAKYGPHVMKREKNEYAYYSCYSRRKINRRMVRDPSCMNKNYKASELEGIVFGEIRKLASDPSYVERMSEKKVQADEISMEKVLRAEMAKINGQRGRLIDLYSIGDFSVEELREKVAELDERRKKLESQVEEISGKVPDLKAEDAKRIIRSFSDVLDRSVTSEIRLLLESLIRRIEIDGDDVTIYWKFS